MKVYLAPNFQNTIGLPPFSQRRLQLWRAAKAATNCKFISFWAQSGLDAKGAEIVATTIPVAWSMRYVASGFASVDPAIVYGLRSAGLKTIDMNALDDGPMVTFGNAAMKAGVGRYAVISPNHGSSGFRTVTTFTFDAIPDENSDDSTALMSAVRQQAYAIAKELAGPQLQAPGKSALLTDRERTVLRLSAQGETYGEIGEMLGISKWTVVAHMKTINTKLGTRNKSEAISKAIAEDLL
ncbi:MAG: helix-turn-helix transcriptional regulator [Pseudomonadota bacterium]